MTSITETDVMKLARTIPGLCNDATFWGGWRTYGPGWAWRYLTAAIARGVDRRGDERPAGRRLRCSHGRAQGFRCRARRSANPMRYGTCTICGEPHQLTQPTGAPPAAIEPCAAIVADGLARPRIPGMARVTRRADPDEVAAAHRSARTGDEIRIYAAGLS